MEDLLALAGEARGAIRHQSLALQVNSSVLLSDKRQSDSFDKGGAHLSGTDDGAEVGLVALAELAVEALWDVEGDDVVTNSNIGHTFSNALHNAASFMAQNAGEHSFRI